MPIFSIDKMFENITEMIVRSMRSEFKNLKNQIKIEIKEEMKLRHMIVIKKISVEY